jgi:hypothetical protein
MFRTDFLDPTSVGHGERKIDDYNQVSEEQRRWLDSMNHAQLGDPAKFGPAIVHIANLSDPPARWGAGSDAIEAFQTRADQLLSNSEQFEALTRSTDVTS